jgi:hypothetical protein
MDSIRSRNFLSRHLDCRLQIADGGFFLCGLLCFNQANAFDTMIASEKLLPKEVESN